MDENERLNKCKSCTGCVDWLSVCKAECCSQFSFKLNGTKKRKFKKNQVLWFNCKLIADRVKYYKFHGCRYWMGRLRVKLDCPFEVCGDWLHVYKRCQLLNENNLCDGHSDGRKPEICEGLNEETCDKGNYVLTKNCLFKYKKKVKDGHNQ